MTTKRLLIIFCLLLSHHAMSENLQFQPGMTVNLGESFDPFAPFEASGLGNCFVTTFRDSTPVATENYTEEFVDSFAEFTQKTGLSLSGSASGSYGLAKVSVAAEYKQDRELFQSSKNVVYIVSGVRTYNSQKVLKISLSEDGVKYLNDANQKSDSSIFYKPCGRGLVTSIVKETKISVAYIFKASSSEKAEAIKAAISAAVSTPKVSGNVAANISSSVKAVDDSVSIDTRVYQSGTLDNSDSIKSVIGLQPGDIASVRESIKKAIMAISWDTSQIKTFNADKISNSFDIPRDPDFSYIANLYKNLDIAKKNADRLVERYIQLDDILSANGTAGFKVKDEAVAGIKDERLSVEKQISDLADMTRLCFEEKRSSCNIPTLDVNRKILDKLTIDFGEFLRWNYIAPGSYNYNTEKVNSSVDFWAVFSLRNLKYISRFEFIQDGTSKLMVLDNDQLLKRVLNNNLELADIKFNASRSEYCWNAHTEGNCKPWSENKSRLANESKSQLAGLSFSAKIIDSEGNAILISVPNISSLNY